MQSMAVIPSSITAKLASNKQVGFFRFRSQTLALAEALVLGLMSRFAVQYSSIGAALRAGTWLSLGKQPLLKELKVEPALVQWPVGTLEVTLWKGASVVGTTQVHDPSIQNLEVISA